ncbi:Muniscin C-terminal mu homology domain-containing protein [Phyllosticta capitalensis]|uniref:Muniscin C-terminal mu homology domain-containing protein n=1 Tax=Phyllosticta capitalensis TaxID=121624 RepID=A0ABR1YEA5_9PEZI
MDLSRREYPAMLDSLEPAQAVAVLNQRLKHIAKVNLDVADFLQERRRLEDAYAQGLRKLAGRQALDSGADLGVFSMPWTKIVSATEALAESHHAFAQKLELDVERNLRDFEKSNREMQTMSTISGNMAAMAKEIEASQKRADKLKGKGEKAPAGKVAAATSDVENALQQWQSQAPYVYEQLQAVDESRINHLRDALTQFQTLELDQIDRTRAPAEQCLSLILDVQTADEVKMFALKTTDGKAKIERTTSRNPGQFSAAQTPSMQPPPTPDDGSSQRSGSGRPPALSQEPRSPSTVHEQKLGGLHGLKRLGTVLGRRKSAVPYARATSPDRRSTANFGSAFSSFGSRVSKSRDADHRPSSPSRLAESQIPSSPNESMVSPGRTVPDRANGIPPVPEHQPNPESEVVNGGLNVNTGIPQLQEPLQPTSSSLIPPEPQKDAEGYSMPGSSTTSDLFSQAEAEAAGENIPPQFKVDIRNAPIQEEDSGDAQAAMANVANTLRMQTAPAKRSGTTRGRRDVRNTIFVPSPQTTEVPAFPDPVSMPPVPPVPTASSSESPVTAPTSPPQLPSARPQSPLRPNSHRINLGDEPPASDTQSIRSGRSLSSAHSHTVKHPDLHEPGLNSSIVETVSAWFENGNVTRAVVIGELALAYNPIDLSVPFGNETIRLENFPVLEKVAPNPTFIDQVQERAGDYTVNLSSITRTQVGFKYQVHLDDSNVASYAPISLSTAWKVEPTQTSVILTYALNPAFKLAPGRSSITLNNAVLVIHLDPTGAKSSHCQSKPVGTFSKDRNLIYWRLGTVTLSKDQPGQQLRARFYTEAEARPSNAEARWEIGGEQAAGQGSGLSVSQMVPPSGGESADAEAADPFADDDGPSTSTTAAAAAAGATGAPDAPTWKPVVTVKKITSGTYTAAA